MFDALTVSGYLRVALLAGVPVGAAAAAGCLYAEQGPALAALVGVLVLAVSGATAAGCVYLAQVALDIRDLHLPAADLLPEELVVLESSGSMVHYRKGRQGGVFDGVGGKLVLTSTRLVFLAHRGQPYHYRVVLPLADVSHVECRPDPGLWPGELLVVMLSGRRELFTFGAIRPAEPDVWAEAIGAFWLPSKFDQADSPG